MPVLTAIEPCEAPESFRERSAGPSLPIDCDILGYLERQAGGRSLSDVRAMVGGTTHHVHSRLQALVDRGLVHRQAVPGGPRRGPGASVYAIVKEASWTCPS